MVRIAGLLDWNVKVSWMAVPAEFVALTLKDWVLPTSRETFGPGVMETTAGTWLLTTRVELLLPHEASSRHPSAAPANAVNETNLPINPSKPTK
jgi:hypothetical protein